MNSSPPSWAASLTAAGSCSTFIFIATNSKVIRGAVTPRRRFSSARKLTFRQ